MNLDSNLFKKAIENYLSTIQDKTLQEATRYCLDSNGKYVRPQLLFSTLKFFNLFVKKYYSFALAVEMIHTYSLIRDDLPCMDDDDFRRGKPSLHKQYDEGMAVLVGDSLLSDAFFILSQHPNKKEAMMAIRCLSQCIGSQGMVYGQILDLKNKNEVDLSNEKRFKIDVLKTGKLFEYCLTLPAMLTNQTQDKIELLQQLAHVLGIIYQIKDDLEDRHNQDDLQLLQQFNTHKQTLLKELQIHPSDDLYQLIQNYF